MANKSRGVDRGNPAMKTLACMRKSTETGVLMALIIALWHPRKKIASRTSSPRGISVGS
jgi:hypothetical protein